MSKRKNKAKMKPIGYKGSDGELTDEGMYNDIDDKEVDKMWEKLNNRTRRKK